jgi:hypothetical protein
VGPPVSGPRPATPPPADPPTGARGVAAAGREGAESATPADAGSGPWRADRRLTVFKVIGVLIFAAAALLVADQVGTFLLAVAALLCLGYAVRDLVAPVRLAADADGLTVIRGYLGHARLSWSDIDHVRVDRRSRLGLRSEFLEIDAGDHLYLLSSYDLSAEPAAVAAALARLRTGA